MNIFQSSELERKLKALAQATGYWNDEEVRQHIELAVLTQDERQIKFFRELFDEVLAQDDSNYHLMLPDPDPGEVDFGEVLLGTLTTGGEARVPVNELLYNTLVVAPPGAGKTVLLTQLVRQLIARNIAVHIFDTQNEYADVLAPLFGGDVLECLDASDCRFNPFDGPSTIPHPDWVLNMMCNYLREAFYWQDRTIELFRTVCLSLFESHDHLTPVMFADAYARIPEGKKRWPEYGSLGRFVTMLRCLPTFQCLRGESIEESTGKSRVYNLRFLAEDARLFLISHIVTFLAMAREYRRDRPLDLLLVFDELSQFFTKDTLRRYQGILESFYLRLLRSDRKWGIGAILADQNYTLMHDVAKSNCQIKLGMDMRDGASRRQFALDLGLNAEQERFLAELSYQQDRRRVVVQLRHYPHPFLMKIPNFTKPEALSEEELRRRRQETLSRMQWSPIPERPERRDKNRDRDLITHEMETYLGVIANSWWLSATQHDRLMKDWSDSKGTRVRALLTEAGLLEEHPVNQFKPGRKIKILLPTRAGYELLDRRRIGYRTPPGNGSIAHRWWQDRIAKVLRKGGWKTEIEQSLGTKRVDVGAVNDLGMKVAYEVLVEGLQKEALNWEKDLADGWHDVVYCVDSEETRQKLAALLPDGLPSVSIRLLSEFV